MKRFLKFAILACYVSGLTAPLYAQQQWNLPLLGHWDDDSIPPAWTGAYSECWGYAHNGYEYAFIGSTQATYFFEITDPTNPRLIQFVRTRDTVNLVVNKDYATYDHYLYAVSDQGNNSLQIFDLQYLPDSVSLVYDSDVISKRCHTLFVERDRLYMCSNTRPDNSFAPMDIFSIADPLNPVLLGTLSNPGFSSVHESYVRNDTAYCSNGYNGLWIYNMANPAAPSLISVISSYPESGYNHSSWLTGDSKHIVFTDENHGRGVKIFDISDIHDEQLVSLFRSNLLQVADSLTDNGSVAHNPYIVGNTLLISYYHDGVQVYDISDPSNPVHTGFYDTYPQAVSYYSYNGCWGLYPFLPSGHIIASDITNGLFILDGTTVLNYHTPEPVRPFIAIWPNPVKDQLVLNFATTEPEHLQIEFYDITGRLAGVHQADAATGSGTLQFDVASLSAGMYVAVVKGISLSLSARFIKTGIK